MNTNKDEWLFDIEDAAEEAKREKDESRTDYRWCEDSLRKYSELGVETFNVYD